MWKCPICETENDEHKNGFICSECEFDQSLNYEHFPSLQITNVSSCKTLNDYRSDYKLVSLKYTCEKCNNKLFYYLPDSGQLICSKCGNELQLTSVNTKIQYNEGECPVELMNENMQDKIQRFPNKPYFYTSISIGKDHYIALCKNGKITAFGSNDYGQCQASGWENIIYICANSQHSFALRKDGTVSMTGSDFQNNPIAKWNSVISLSVRDDYALGLQNSGHVVLAGNPPFDIDLISKWDRISSISAGLKHAVGLLKNGSVVTIGDNTKGQCNTYDNNKQPWQDIIAISAGDYHTLALKSDGTVYATGDNSDGQCDVNDLKHIVAISAGARHSVFLTEDGCLIVKGNTSAGQDNIRVKRDIIAISAYGDSTLALLPNDMLQRSIAK